MNQKKWNKQYLDAAHKHSIYNRQEILKSTKCGCFYCGHIFTPAELDEEMDWTDDYASQTTALCPVCMIDSVIGDASGFPVADKTFLDGMYEYFFEGICTIE